MKRLCLTGEGGVGICLSGLEASFTRFFFCCVLNLIVLLKSRVLTFNVILAVLLCLLNNPLNSAHIVIYFLNSLHVIVLLLYHLICTFKHSFKTCLFPSFSKLLVHLCFNWNFNKLWFFMENPLLFCAFVKIRFRRNRNLLLYGLLRSDHILYFL